MRQNSLGCCTLSLQHNPLPKFQYSHFERIKPELNVAHYYYLAFVSTLLGPAVVRLRRGYGLKQPAA